MTTHITVKHLSNRWSVSIATIWRWSRLNKIPAPYKLGENCTRWKLSEIEQYEATQEAK